MLRLVFAFLLATALLHPAAAQPPSAPEPPKTDTEFVARVANTSENQLIAWRAASSISPVEVAERRDHLSPAIVTVAARTPGGQSRIGFGFFIDDDGFILTSHRGIEDAERITVLLHDGRLYEADLVGSDPITDVAIVRVNGRGFAFVTLASRRAVAGQTLVVVHKDGAWNAAVLAGHSGDYLVIDDPAQLGDAGGPVFDLRGSVVAFVVASLPREGRHLAMVGTPAHVARFVANSIIKNGRVLRGWLGVQAEPLDRAAAGPPAFDVSAGVRITAVDAGGPAERAGLRPGDEVVAWDGAPPRNSDLDILAAGFRPEKTITLDVRREGRRQEVSVRLGLRPPEEDRRRRAHEPQTPP